MSVIKRSKIIVVVCLLLLITGRSVYACSIGSPRSFVEFTDDMDHFFVMLVEGAKGLNDRYDASGLYRLDGSRYPIWTVDWFSSRVFPHVDGRLLVQLGARTNSERGSFEHRTDQDRKLYYKNPVLWAEKELERRHAISFFDAGKLIHEYRLGDLFGDLANVEHGPCGWINWISDFAFDEKAKTFKLATLENLSYTFSTVTGEILEIKEFQKGTFTGKQISVDGNGRSGSLSDAKTDALLELIQTQWDIVGSLAPQYLSDYSLAKKIIGVHGVTYRYFDASIQSKRELSLLAVTSGQAAMINQLAKYSSDKKILIAGVRHDGRNYNLLPDDLKNNKKLLLRALPHAGMYVYSGAPENLRADREVVIEALRSQLRASRSDRDTRFNIGLLGSIPERYLDDDRVKHLIDGVIEVHSANYAIPMAQEFRKKVYSMIRKNTDR